VLLVTSDNLSVG